MAQDRKFAQDYTPGGVRIIGQWENDRNGASRKLVHDIFAHLYGPDVQTIIAHHLCYQIQDGDYFIVEEIPSMDSLIFDHELARKLWGDNFRSALQTLATLPAEERDYAFGCYFYEAHGTAEQRAEFAANAKD